MAASHHPSPDPLTIAQNALEALASSFDTLDASAIDGLLAGMAIQPRRPLLDAAWLDIVDPERRHAPADAQAPSDAPALPAHPALDRLRQALKTRLHEIERAVDARDWFDPWVFELEDDEDGLPAMPLETVLPWVAGFALAMERFPDLLANASPDALEALATVYQAFDPEDLEDADELLAAMADLEPPDTLEEAVENLVWAVLSLADESRPKAPPPRRR